MLKSNRRAILFATCGALLVLVFLFVKPVSTYYTRALSLVLVAGLWSGLSVLYWHLRLVRLVLVLSVLIMGSLVFGPGRGMADDALPDAYVSELLRYKGTSYVWGGESRFGIDCSGLVRSALVNAAILRGVASVNPSLVRFGISLWWHDRTAQQLGESYLGETRAIADTDSINATDQSILHVGDLAVTRSGVHVLAYIGGSSWIEADPGAHSVIVVHVPERFSSWFGVPVRIVRWRAMDAGLARQST